VVICITNCASGYTAERFSNQYDYSVLERAIEDYSLLQDYALLDRAVEQYLADILDLEQSWDMPEYSSFSSDELIVPGMFI
jgi:hypothetical protein